MWQAQATVFPVEMTVDTACVPHKHSKKYGFCQPYMCDIMPGPCIALLPRTNPPHCPPSPHTHLPQRGQPVIWGLHTQGGQGPQHVAQPLLMAHTCGCCARVGMGYGSAPAHGRARVGVVRGWAWVMAQPLLMARTYGCCARAGMGCVCWAWGVRGQQGRAPTGTGPRGHVALHTMMH